MSTAEPARTVAAAIEGVAAWRAEEARRIEAELGEVAQEMAGLEAAVQNLQQQLEALKSFRADLEAKSEDIDAVSSQRTYGALFDALSAQAQAMETRDAAQRAAREAAEAKVMADLAAGPLGAVMAEYEQFKVAVMPTLDKLPETYRAAMLDVHQAQEAKLADATRDAVAGIQPPALPSLAVDLVFAIDAPDDTPELVVVVLPVVEAVHSGWLERPDGLLSALSARVAMALYQASLEAGFATAQALCGGHRGLLAVEVDLIGADASVAEALRRRLSEVAAAPELSVAGLALTVTELSMDHLLPPDEGDEESDDVE